MRIPNNIFVRPLRQFYVSIFAVVFVFWSNSVSADIVLPIPSTDLGTVSVFDDQESGVAFLMKWGSSESETCTVFDNSECRPAEFEVEWTPRNLPVLLKLTRSGSQTRGLITLLVHDRKMQNACWTYFEIPEDVSQELPVFRSTVDNKFKDWMGSCSYLKSPLKDRVAEVWRTAQPSLLAPLSIISASRPESLFSTDEELSFGTGSFLPREIDQGILDMIAAVCEASNRPLLGENDNIVWEADDQLVNPPGGNSSDSCVDWQIGHFPGYPKIK